MNVGVGRGRWDRSRTAIQRVADGREALLEATRRATSEHGDETTVAHVIALAGVGRNTFYAHFPDLRAARDAAEDSDAERFSTALAAELAVTTTPRERLRAVARAWLDASAGSVAPGRQARRVGRLERALRDVLSEARAAGMISREADAFRVRCLAGAFLSAAEDGAEQRRDVRDETAEILLDLAVRVFR